MDEDWRVRVRFEDAQAASEHAARLEATRIERDEQAQLAGRIVVSLDGSELFLYAANEDDARAAEDLARRDAEADQWPADVELTRWHDVAEDWEPPERPLPGTPDERAAERARLMKREDRETADEGYAEWEVRIELPSHREARELADRLDSEGVPHVRRWKYLLVGATDEDAAKEWADRLRREAPSDAHVSVEGTFRAIEQESPFAVLRALTGEP